MTQPPHLKELMAANSKIEWLHGKDGKGAGATWNPIRARLKGSQRWGYHCERISPGCQRCYACTMNGRTLPSWGTGLDYTVPNREKVEIFLDEKELLKPLSWRKPKTIFPCSMTDAFADFVPDEFLDRVFAVAALCPQHRFLFLTKRAKRMQEYLRESPSLLNGLTPIDGAHLRVFGRMVEILPSVPARALNNASDWQDRHYPGGDGFMRAWPLPNVWLGVSVENQQYADERIPLLLQTPAAVRWVSAEPLLGAVDLTHIEFRRATWYDALEDHDGFGLLGAQHQKLNWVVVGGESGPGARPCDVAWIRSIVRQCKAARVACFCKQIGRNPIFGGQPLAVTDKKGGAMEEWPPDIRVREMPCAIR